MNNEYGPFRAFSKVPIGKDTWDLCFGESPHQVNENNMFAKTGDAVIPFDGHRIPFKIEIEEFNYVKSSGLSGDQIRKGCTAKLYVSGELAYDDWARDYEGAYRKIQDFIAKMELNWNWYPLNKDTMIGRKVAYWNQLFTITYVGVNRLKLTPVSGHIEKPLWMGDEDWDNDRTIVTSIVDPEIKWHVKE